MLRMQYMRPCKAKCSEIVWNNYENHTGRLKIRHFTDINLKAMGQEPGIETTHKRFIDDCDFYSEIIDTEDSETSIKGKVLYAGYFRKAWGHFIMNSTARLWPLFTTNDKYEAVVFFAEDKENIELHGNYKEFFRLIGIEHKCIILPPDTYHFEDLTIGEISLEIDRYYSSEFLLPFNAVRKRVLTTIEAIKDKYKGVILLRSEWNEGNDIQQNVKCLEDMFIANGYISVSPESTSLSDLILMMEATDNIVSFSGSSAHNILFSGGKKLIILERCAANNIYQIGITKMLGNECIPVDCFYQPLLVSSTDNLTIYGLTPQFCTFADDYGIKVMSDKNADPRKEFNSLLKFYRRRYGYSVGLNSWETSQLSAIAEAYFESYPRYCKYLERKVPVMWYDWFSPRVYVRMLRTFLHS